MLPVRVEDEKSQQSIDFVLSFKRGGANVPLVTNNNNDNDDGGDILPPPPLPPSAPPPLPPPPPLPVAMGNTPDTNIENEMTDSSQDSEDNLVINMDSDSDAVPTPTKANNLSASLLVKRALENAAQSNEESAAEDTPSKCTTHFLYFIELSPEHSVPRGGFNPSTAHLTSGPSLRNPKFPRRGPFGEPLADLGSFFAFGTWFFQHLSILRRRSNKNLTSLLMNVGG